jgi:hypothetical protein
MPAWLVPLIVLDLIVTAAVVIWIVRRRAAGLGGKPTALVPGMPDFAALKAFANASHPRIGEYVRANWSGIPDDLPQVLTRLLDVLEGDAKSHGLTLDRGVLKQLVESSLRTHRVGNGRAIGEALKRVA